MSPFCDNPVFPDPPPNPLSPLTPNVVPFDKVIVDFLVLGNARVTWFVNPLLRKPGPWTFQLQISETDAPTGDWTNTGPVLTNVYTTIDPNRVLFAGKDQNVYYRVVLTTGNGESFVSPAATIYGALDYHSYRIAQEIIRKEDLRNRRLHVAVDGSILKLKRSGIRCPTCIDKLTDEVTDSRCPTCLGTGWEGGYYAPVPCSYADLELLQLDQKRDLQSEGMVMAKNRKGRFLATPFLAAYDIWVNQTSDERFFVHPVSIVAQVREVPIILTCDLRSMPFDDFLYNIPVQTVET